VVEVADPLDEIALIMFWAKTTGQTHNAKAIASTLLNSPLLLASHTRFRSATRLPQASVG